MQEALQVANSAVNFVKANALHDRLLLHLCEDEEHQVHLMHTEVHWVSKGNTLVHLAKMWLKVLVFDQHMKTEASSKKQKDKAKALFSVINTDDTKAKLFYLADIFPYSNQFNKTLQGPSITVLDCTKVGNISMNKLSLWKSHMQKKSLPLLEIEP